MTDTIAAKPRIAITNPRVILPTPDIGGVAYSSCHVQMPKGSDVPELLYTQGGTFPREFGDTDPRGGFSDPTKVWRKLGGRDWHPLYMPWYPHAAVGSPTNIVADNSVHPWMLDRVFVAKHPECHVGSFGGPCVYRDSNGLFHMWRPATVGDPAMTTKRMFVIYHYVSPNGLDWSLVHYRRRHPNVAVQAAALWFGEFTGARDYPSERGLTSVWAWPANLLNPNDDQTYMFVQVWAGGDGPTVQKNAFVIMRERWAEMWSDNVEAGVKGHHGPISLLDDGEFPDWYTKAEHKPLEDRWTVGNMHAWIIEQVIETPLQFGKLGSHMLVSAPTPAIRVAFTNDYIHINEQVGWLTVEGSDKFFNVGTPRIDQGGDVIRFATADAGLIMGDPSKYGQKIGDQFGAAHVVESDCTMEMV